MPRKSTNRKTRVASAFAAAYPRDLLDRFEQAIDTAIDDSYEWSKHSDEGDDRRRIEAEDLSELSCIIGYAIDIKDEADAKKGGGK